MALHAYFDYAGIPMSEKDYLATELGSDVRREYIDGQVYAMAGSSINHNILSLNIASEFRNHLKGKPCTAFIGDIKVPLKVSVGHDYVYPDVVVDCTKVQGQSYFSNAPTLIVEVLSQSTRKSDLTTKLLRYINLPSLQEYVVIEQDFVQVQVLRKSNAWKPDYYYLGDLAVFESIALTLAVEAIYEQVDNQDMAQYLMAKQGIADAVAIGGAVEPAAANGLIGGLV